MLLSEYFGHPNANKIPFLVMQLVFNCEFSDQEDLRMVGSLSQASFPLTDTEDPLRALLCVSYAHESCIKKEWFVAAKNMGVGNEIIVKAAMITGRYTPADDKLLSLDTLISIIEKDYYRVVFFAAIGNHSHILKHIVATLSMEKSKQMIRIVDHRIIKQVSKYTHLRSFKILAPLLDPEELFEIIIKDDLFLLQCILNNPTEIRELVEDICGRKVILDIIEHDDYKFIYKLVKENVSVEALNYLLGLVDSSKWQEMLAANNYKIFTTVLCNQNWNLIMRLLQQADEPTRKAMLEAHDYLAFRLMAHRGNRRLFHYLAGFIVDLETWDKMFQSLQIYGFRSAQSKDDLLARDNIISIVPAHLKTQFSVLMSSGHNGYHNDTYTPVYPLIISNKKSELPHREKKKVGNLLIQSPKQNCIYELQSPGFSHPILSVTIEGTNLDMPIDLNVSFLNTSWSSDPSDLSDASDNRYSFETRETLPIGLDIPRYPLYLYSYSKRSVSPIVHLHFKFDTAQLEVTTQAVEDKQILKSDNSRLEEECQILANNIPVKTEKHPIFAVNQRPSFAFLTELYSQFWRHNKGKIGEQNRLSLNLCHVRAHVMSIILKYYGIESLKIVKFWNQGDWAFYDDRNWRFHCALMVIDSSNEKWVWDPWVGLHAKLLTLPQWLGDINTPKPTKVIVLNRGMLSHIGIIPNEFFNCHHSAFNAGTFQAIFGSVIPNSPERPITNASRATFFERERNRPKSEVIKSNAFRASL